MHDVSQPELHVLADPAAAVGELLAQQARAGGTIVLTGGSTPGRAYERAAALSPDWHRVSLWWGDERCVPPDDELSNYRLARETLLDRLGTPPGEVHRIRGELAPADAAADYDAALDGVRIDLLLLGLGSDGHMASLFPGSPQLAVTDRTVTSGPAGLTPFVDRVTLTLPALRSAARIVFLVAGADKAPAVEAAFARPVSDTVPASLIRTGAAVRAEVFLDGAAAGRIGDT